jgi:hypothetical protein
LIAFRNPEILVQKTVHKSILEKVINHSVYSVPHDVYHDGSHDHVHYGGSYVNVYLDVHLYDSSDGNPCIKLAMRIFLDVFLVSCGYQIFSVKL